MASLAGLAEPPLPKSIALFSASSHCLPIQTCTTNNLTTRSAQVDEFPLLQPPSPPSLPLLSELNFLKSPRFLYFHMPSKFVWQVLALCPALPTPPICLLTDNIFAVLQYFVQYFCRCFPACVPCPPATSWWRMPSQCSGSVLASLFASSSSLVRTSFLCVQKMCSFYFHVEMSV